MLRVRLNDKVVGLTEPDKTKQNYLKSDESICERFLC